MSTTTASALQRAGPFLQQPGNALRQISGTSAQERLKMIGEMADKSIGEGVEPR